MRTYARARRAHNRAKLGIIVETHGIKEVKKCKFMQFFFSALM